MNINYQLEMEKVINSLNGKTPTLLLHACCGPCSSYCLEVLSNYFKISILYYNPNISPYTEYLKRKEELLACIFIFANYLICFAGPIAYLRYALPMIVCAPFVIFMTFREKKG